MCKKNAVFGKYVSVPTDCIGCRHSSFRGTGLKVKMHRKMEKSLMDLEGVRKLTESTIEGQSLLNLKALIIKTASICLLPMWRGRRFNSTRMSSYLRVDVLALLKNLL
jgi:hypothetical protein